MSIFKTTVVEIYLNGKTMREVARAVGDYSDEARMRVQTAIAEFVSGQKE